MYATPPDKEEALKNFYRKVRPAGPGWKPIAVLCPEVEITDKLGRDILGSVVGIIFAS